MANRGVKQQRRGGSQSGEVTGGGTVCELIL